MMIYKFKTDLNVMKKIKRDEKFLQRLFCIKQRNQCFKVDFNLSGFCVNNLNVPKLRMFNKFR